MSVAAMLRHRRTELEAQLALIQKDLDDLERALAAIGASPESTNAPQTPAARKAGEQPQGHPMPVDEAILIAVANRCRTPASILNYLTRELKVHTTVNSVRTRVSRLRSEGRLIRTAMGWMLPSAMDGLQGKSLFDRGAEAD